MRWMDSVNEFRNLHYGGVEPAVLSPAPATRHGSAAEEAIACAMELGTVTAVTTTGVYGDRTTVGVVVAYDPAERVAKMKTRAGTMRIDLTDVLHVSRV